jgi:cytochrome c
LSDKQERFMRVTAKRIIGVAALLADSSPSLAESDAAAEELAFTATCSACHSTAPGVNKIGPSLAGIVGAKSGAAPGCDYSRPLKAWNITSDEQTLDKFLENPPGVHGTKMVFRIPDAEDRHDIIAYLKTMKP